MCGGQTVGFKMASKQDPELTSSHRHNKATTTYGLIPSKRHLKFNEESLHNKGIKESNKTGRSRDMDSPGKTHPSLSESRLGRITKVRNFFLRSEVFKLRIRHPNP